MKKYLYFLIILFLVIILPSEVSADCTDTEIVRLSNIAKNVTYSYQYDEKTDRFSITFTNLTNEIKLVSAMTKKEYTSDKEITINNFYSGSYKFNIYAKNNKCTSDILTTRYIKMPYINDFYNSELCKGIEDYSYCSKWVDSKFSYDVWYSKVTKYKEKLEEKEKIEKKEVKGIFDKTFELLIYIYINYYYIILPLIIIILCSIIYYKNKKNDLV